MPVAVLTVVESADYVLLFIVQCFPEAMLNSAIEPQLMQLAAASLIKPDAGFQQPEPAGKGEVLR
ncbi:hypothetical protein D3C76_940940 [compost metagenome]